MTSSYSISVIIPAYNAARFIENTIQSVLNQTFPPIEIIVVDDGSTDDTAAILSAMDHQVVYFHKDNGGVSSARNLGTKKAQGEFLAFLDADDQWEPNKLEQFVKALETFHDKRPGIVFSDLTRWDFFSGERYEKKNSDIYPYIAEYSSEHRGSVMFLDRMKLFELILRKYDIFPSTLMVSKTVASEIDWPDHRRIGEDFYFNLLASLHSDAVYIDNALSRLMRHDTNNSIDYESFAYAEVDGLNEVLSSGVLTNRQQRLARKYYGQRICGIAYHLRKNQRYGEALRKYFSALQYPSSVLFVLRGVALTLISSGKSILGR